MKSTQNLTTSEQQPQDISQSKEDTENSKSYPLLTREPLQKTPFWIVGSEEIGYKLTWGKFTFNDDALPTQNKVVEWYEENKWQIILHLIAIGIASIENQWKDDPKPEGN